MTTIKNIILEEINKYLNESEWNFHHTSDDIKGYGKPYASDNRYNMIGRDTGHFGSGTYFSTYNTTFDKRDDIRKYTSKPYNDNPEFIKVNDGIYRVDFDIYKNLYKVNGEKEGDILYTTLRSLNRMFNAVSYKNFNQSHNYQIIKNNCNALGLKCPNYITLIRLMQKYDKSNNILSFSTYFMELNGYNGVNVSGIPKYDNTTHGSVIYDLSKKQLTPIENNKNILGSLKYNGDTVARKDQWDKDAYTSSITGDNDYPIYRIKNMDSNTQKRIIKNFIDSQRFFTKQEIEQLDDNMVKFYMRQIYTKRPSDRYTSFDEYLDNQNIMDIVRKHKLYYWVNYIPTDHRYKTHTPLIELLGSVWENEDYDFYDNPKEENIYKKKYLETLTEFMKRKLTKEEKEFINNDYYDNE